MKQGLSILHLLALGVAWNYEYEINRMCVAVYDQQKRRT